MKNDGQAARRIAMALVTAARNGTPMSVATFVTMCADAGLRDSEDILRTSIRANWLLAEIVRALSDILSLTGFPGDDFLRQIGLRIAAEDN